MHNTGAHPGCETQHQQMDVLAGQLRNELTEIIHWSNDNSPRSLQKAIGPSELGTPCDRRIAYKLAGNRVINNRRDPWPAIVGTAIHGWLERAVNEYQEQVLVPVPYVTEQELYIDPLVLGHTDVYRDGVVVDYKTCGPDVLKKVTRHGAPVGYKIQTQLYGKGHVDAGRKVTHVALIFLPRSGWLSDMFVWTDVYRPDIAQASLDRMYSIGRGLIAADIENNPHVYDKIPAAEDHCGYCPFFLRGGSLTGASNEGCPGV
jgi:hypothetical protein